MKKLTPRVAIILMPLFAAIIICMTSCQKQESRPSEEIVSGPDVTFYSITASGQLAKFNAMAPQNILSSVSISGLQPGETILAIDFRPATGELYGLGSSSRLYIINTATGSSRSVMADPFTPAINGSIAGFDFNPTVDRIRIVTSTGQNLRVHPETGMVAFTDGTINGADGASVNAVAYTNSMAGAAATTLFDIDVTTQKLYKQTPPNNGTLSEVGSLGINVAGEGGFDISPDNSAILASLMVDGKSSLYKIDTATGTAKKIGNFPDGDAVKGIAIPTNPVAYAVDEMNNFLIFNPFSAAAPVTKPISGLVAGDVIEGIDFRPASGQIYALGKLGNLYTINTSSGAAAMVGSGSFATLTGVHFGFDFNPTVDRIRVVTTTGLNLRLHPVTGALVAMDGNLNPGIPNISGAGYANNFAGATTTTLYDIDCQTDKLYTQAPPNDGTLVEVGPLGLNISSAGGFDIGSSSGIAYGIFNIGDNAGMYKIDLTTGAATKLSDFPVKVKGFTIGLGF